MRPAFRRRIRNCLWYRPRGVKEERRHVKNDVERNYERGDGTDEVTLENERKEEGKRHGGHQVRKQAMFTQASPHPPQAAQGVKDEDQQEREMKQDQQPQRRYDRT